MHARGFKVMSALQCNNHNPEGPSYFRGWALVFLIIAILLCGFSMADDERNDPRTIKKEIPMPKTSVSAVSAVPIPPIDAVAYARVETATFALG